MSPRRYFSLSAILFGTLTVFPLIVKSAEWQSTLIIAFYYALLAIAWDILGGYTGQISFAVAAFGSIGAYTAALLAPHGVTPVIGILIGSLVAAAVGYLLGRISLKLSGAYFALITLAFAEVVRLIIVNEWQWTRGELGLEVQPLLPSTASYIAYYYIFLAVLFIIQIGVYVFLNSPMGLYLQAIRDNEMGAKAAGINTVRWKAIAAAISSGIAGLGGALYVHFLQLAVPQMGSIAETGKAIAVTVIGGIGTLAGPIFGAVLMRLVEEALRSFGSYHLLLFGLLLMVFVRFFQEGLIGFFARFQKGRVSHGNTAADPRSH